MSSLDIAVLHEGAHEQPVLVAGRLHDEVPLLGQRVVVARGHEQVLPALALVRTGHAHVGRVALIGIVHETEYALGRLHHQRAYLKVGAVQHVDRRRVRRQDQRTGIDQVLHYADRLATDPGLREAAAHPKDRGGGDAVEKGSYTPHKVEIVVGQPHRLLVRRTVGETQRADAGLHLVRGCYRFWNICGIFRFRMRMRHRRQRQAECRDNAVFRNPCIFTCHFDLPI